VLSSFKQQQRRASEKKQFGMLESRWFGQQTWVQQTIQTAGILTLSWNARHSPSGKFTGSYVLRRSRYGRELLDLVGDWTRNLWHVAFGIDRTYLVCIFSIFQPFLIWMEFEKQFFD
jgi:hypothetical protein